MAAHPVDGEPERIYQDIGGAAERLRRPIVKPRALPGSAGAIGG
jgi:hypothetical protein